MPCRCDDIPNDNYRAEADRLAAMLCMVCQDVEGRGQILPANVAQWWAAHKESDRLRAEADAEQRATDAIRARAFAKLTKTERHALGL